MKPSPEFAPLFKLPLDQRLQLVQDLWDSIADEQPELPVPDWQVQELRRRAATYHAGESQTLSREDVERMIDDDK